MSICKQFYNLSEEDIGDVVIFYCFDVLHIIRKTFKANILQEFQGYYKGITIQICNIRISIIITGSGDSRVGDAVLALRNCKVKGLIYSGTAGGLGENKCRGDLFVAENAVCGDGFTRYYRVMDEDVFKNIVHSSQDMLTVFCNFMEKYDEKRLKIHFGRIFTIDSIFAETDKLIDDMITNKCHAIDMETAAFYTAAQELEKGGLAIHYISDIPKKEINYDMFRKECLRAYFLLPKLLVSYASFYSSKCETNRVLIR